LTQEPFFLWLHPLSALMAECDELHDQKDPVEPASVAALRQSLEALVTDGGQPPSEGSFVARYLAILQDSADVIMLHAKLRRALDALTDRAASV
jgi:hypothetical protein